MLDKKEATPQAGPEIHLTALLNALPPGLAAALARSFSELSLNSDHERGDPSRLPLRKNSSSVRLLDLSPEPQSGPAPAPPKFNSSDDETSSESLPILSEKPQPRGWAQARALVLPSSGADLRPVAGPGVVNVSPVLQQLQSVLASWAAAAPTPVPRAAESSAEESGGHLGWLLAIKHLLASLPQGSGTAPASALGADSGGLPHSLLRLLSRRAAHYRELGQLGRGGFGSVSACQSLLDHRIVAVKRVKFKSSVPPWSPVEIMYRSHEKLLREVRALAALRHPGVAQYHDCWIEADWEGLFASLGVSADPGSPAGGGGSDGAIGGGSGGGRVAGRSRQRSGGRVSGRAGSGGAGKALLALPWYSQPDSVAPDGSGLERLEKSEDSGSDSRSSSTESSDSSDSSGEEEESEEESSSRGVTASDRSGNPAMPSSQLSLLSRARSEGGGGGNALGSVRGAGWGMLPPRAVSDEHGGRGRGEPRRPQAKPAGGRAGEEQHTLLQQGGSAPAIQKQVATDPKNSEAEERRGPVAQFEIEGLGSPSAKTASSHSSGASSDEGAATGSESESESESESGTGTSSSSSGETQEDSADIRGHPTTDPAQQQQLVRFQGHGELAVLGDHGGGGRGGGGGGGGAQGLRGRQRGRGKGRGKKGKGPTWSYHLIISMELVQGASLDKWLDARAAKALPVDVPLCLAIFRKIVQAVAYVHSQGILHRDLKPANVMVAPAGRGGTGGGAGGGGGGGGSARRPGVRVCVVDFGLAVADTGYPSRTPSSESSSGHEGVDAGHGLGSVSTGSSAGYGGGSAEPGTTAAGFGGGVGGAWSVGGVWLAPVGSAGGATSASASSFEGPSSGAGGGWGPGGGRRTGGIGTATYAAPEQTAGLPYDGRADVFSLGIILVELFCPFGTKMERAMALQAARQGRVPPEMRALSPEAADMATAMLQRNPANRPTAAELLRAPLMQRRRTQRAGGVMRSGQAPGVVARSSEAESCSGGAGGAAQGAEAAVAAGVDSALAAGSNGQAAHAEWWQHDGGGTPSQLVAAAGVEGSSNDKRAVHCGKGGSAASSGGDTSEEERDQRHRRAKEDEIARLRAALAAAEAALAASTAAGEMRREKRGRRRAAAAVGSG